MGDTSLFGQVVLIVEPGINRFGHDLQTALERRGAETLIIHNGLGLDKLRAFSFSAGLVNCNPAPAGIDELLHYLSGIPVLLYGIKLGGPVPLCNARLSFGNADVGSVVKAFCSLLRSGQ